ncbi:MAG: EamA family transporter [Mediterranea sp.]|jgi:drug/metabolite transporter (DMT)-like permease|nr:EamA family transporter [Mediterranea sp.]
MGPERPSAAPAAIAIVVAYFLIYVVWGSTYYFIGVAMRQLPPFVLGALRFTTAGLLLLAWCGWRRERVFAWELIRKSAVSGVVLLFIDQAVIMLAQRYVSSSLVAIIASSTAIWIMALDAPMWRRNFRSLSIVGGIVLGFFGVVMLYAEQAAAGDDSVSTRGVLILVFGCLSWALGTLYAKYRSGDAEAVNAFGGTAWQMIIAGGVFWACALFRGEVGETNFATTPATTWLTLAYLVVFGSILAYSAYIWLLKVRPAAEVGTYAYVNPLIAVFFGGVFGGEHISVTQMAGLAVILASVALVSRR